MKNGLSREGKEEGCFRKKLKFQNFSSNGLLEFSELTEKDLMILFPGFH